MDTINRGGERPHLLTCGTNGSSQTRQGNSIQFEDIRGKNNSYNGWTGPQDTSGKFQNIYLPLRTVFSSAHRIYSSCTLSILLYGEHMFYSHCFKRPLKLVLMHYRGNSKYHPKSDAYFMSFCTNICIRSVLVRQHAHHKCSFSIS